MKPTRQNVRTTRRDTKAETGAPEWQQQPGPARSTGDSKLARILLHISRPEGASLAELVAVTGWQPHSVRGALAGSLKRKGHAVVSEKVEGERRYRIGAPQ